MGNCELNKGIPTPELESFRGREDLEKGKISNNNSTKNALMYL